MEKVTMVKGRAGKVLTGLAGYSPSKLLCNHKFIESETARIRTGYTASFQNGAVRETLAVRPDARLELALVRITLASGGIEHRPLSRFDTLPANDVRGWDTPLLPDGSVSDRPTAWAIVNNPESNRITYAYLVGFPIGEELPVGTLATVAPHNAERHSAWIARAVRPADPIPEPLADPIPEPAAEPVKVKVPRKGKVRKGR